MKRPSRIINEANSFLDIDSNRLLLHDFLQKFSECEVYCRPVLIAYYKSNGIEIAPEEIALNRQDIKDAFCEDGVYFDDSKLLTRLFGAENKPGYSSCRWLRNKITHEMMIRAIREVCNRHDALIEDMNIFINEVESQSK